MSQVSMKIRKVNQINPKTQEKGFGTRVLTNGTETFDDLCEYGSHNTAMHQGEIKLAATLIIEAAVRAIKSGRIVDLGVLGKLQPTINGKWTATAEEQVKSDLTLGVRYVPSDDIANAIAAIKLSWSNAKDEATDVSDDATAQTGDDAGSSSSTSGTGTTSGGGQDLPNPTE